MSSKSPARGAKSHRPLRPARTASRAAASAKRKDHKAKPARSHASAKPAPKPKPSAQGAAKSSAHSAAKSGVPVAAKSAAQAAAKSPSGAAPAVPASRPAIPAPPRPPSFAPASSAPVRPAAPARPSPVAPPAPPSKAPVIATRLGAHPAPLPARSPAPLPPTGAPLANPAGRAAPVRLPPARPPASKLPRPTTRSFYWSELRVGDNLPLLVKPPIDRVQIARYAGAAGDFNRLQLDEPYANALGFRGAFAPGALAMGFVGAAHHLAQARSRAQALGAIRQNHLAGRRADLPRRVAELRKEKGACYADLELWAENQKGELVLRGQATCELYETPGSAPSMLGAPFAAPRAVRRRAPSRLRVNRERGPGRAPHTPCSPASRPRGRGLRCAALAALLGACATGASRPGESSGARVGSGAASGADAGWASGARAARTVSWSRAMAVRPAARERRCLPRRGLARSSRGRSPKRSPQASSRSCARRGGGPREQRRVRAVAPGGARTPPARRCAGRPRQPGAARGGPGDSAPELLARLSAEASACAAAAHHSWSALLPEAAAAIDAGQSPDAALASAPAAAAEPLYLDALCSAAWARAQGFTYFVEQRSLLGAELARAAALAVHLDDAGPNRELGRLFAALPGYAGGDLAQARAHFEAAIAAAPAALWNRVLYARSVAIKAQDRALFTRLLGEVLASPAQSTNNRSAQAEARSLLDRADDLFGTAAVPH